eukprot:jgi/Ulvmu1/316/UM001_0320.1
MTEVKGEERIATSQPGAAPASLEVAIRSTDGERVAFKVKPTTLLEKIISVYCGKKKINRQEHRFLFDGKLLEHTQDITVTRAGMENGDHIDCMFTQVGGASI